VLADEFIRKVWFPAGMLAVAVTAVLAFLLDDPVSDNVVGLIIGLTLIGLPVLYAVYRRTAGPKRAEPGDAGSGAASGSSEAPGSPASSAGAGSRRL
jgi:hypothetical protein